MKKIKFEKFFTIEIPEYWDYSEDEGIISFFSEKKGVGVLQLSVAKPNKTASRLNLESLMREYCEKNCLEGDLESTNLDNRKMSVIKFLKDQTFWKVWYVLIGDNILFITYNCEEEDIDKEISIVNSIIDTIQVDY